jgi:catechol 2,3-dioxygenase-like lactoylglutathione lyase family enzyme
LGYAESNWEENLHPLELLSFPAAALPPIWQKARGSFLGIDHTAISVSNTAASVAFYETLGYTVIHQSINQGAEQDRLDDLRSAVVTVTTLELAEQTPHLELLCYDGIGRGYRVVPHSNDIAATRIVGGAETLGDQTVRDPDGGQMKIEPSATVGQPATRRGRADFCPLLIIAMEITWHGMSSRLHCALASRAPLVERAPAR